MFIYRNQKGELKKSVPGGNRQVRKGGREKSLRYWGERAKGLEERGVWVCTGGGGVLGGWSGREVGVGVHHNIGGGGLKSITKHQGVGQKPRLGVRIRLRGSSQRECTGGHGGNPTESDCRKKR